MYVSHPLVRPNTVELRKYQESIIARAIDANTLVILPTGLGKTIIAAMVAAHRVMKFPESKILFLAPTRPLVVQHCSTFLKILKPSDMAVLTGKDSFKKRFELWQKNRFIFATPQTIENDIYRGLSLENVSLLIIDECHRSVGNYSYVTIAQEYMKKARNPLILGLTASPSSDKETINEIVKNLFIERIEAKTEKDRDVREYVKKVEVEWVKVELPEEFKAIKKSLEDMLKERLLELKNRGYLTSFSPKEVSRRELLEVQSKIRSEISAGNDLYEDASIVAEAIKLNYGIELLETQGLYSLHKYLEKLEKERAKSSKNLFRDERLQNLKKAAIELLARGMDHPKLDKLLELVKEHKEKKMLIFTQYRDSVDKIIEVLKHCEGIRVHEFVGQASRDGKIGMTQKKQIEILEKFRNHEYNVLVATQVAEEGIDIPKVDLVIFYEPVPSEIRSIQRRGRTGRSDVGKLIVLITKNTRDEAYYWAAFYKEKKMRELITDLTYELEMKKKQPTLEDFIFERVEIKRGSRKLENKDVKIRIYADFRERASDVLKFLREKDDVELFLSSLSVGDFILSERVCVERKTQADFLSSIVDNRLFPQAVKLAESYEIPVIIIEGSQDIYALRDIHPNAIRGALSALAIDLGIRLIFSRDAEDTAQYIYQIAKREQIEERKEVRIRGEKKPLTLEDMQRYIVESLPNVSSVLAKRLLEKFGSVRAVFNAPVHELMKVEGIGKVKAEQIRKVIDSKYGEDQNVKIQNYLD